MSDPPPDWDDMPDSGGAGSDPTLPYKEAAPLSVDEPSLTPGFVLGKYSIVRHLASGAMGHVYEAEHTILRKRHAIKVIRKRFASDPDFVARFRYEARVMAALEHPHIVRVTDYGADEGYSYFVMDFISGPDGVPMTLQDLLGPANQLQPLPEEEVREIFLQICSALSFSHSFGSEGIVHRDLKPANIMIREGMDAAHRVAVADFGLARMLGRDDSFSTIISTEPDVTTVRNQEVSGTPRFMSPEQWTVGAPLGPATDIYSAGVMLYLALTGAFPFQDSRELLGDDPLPLTRLPSDFGCDSAWDSIVQQCLQKRASDRYASVEALRADIERVGQVTRRRTPGWAVVSGALVIGCLVGVASWLGSTRQQEEMAAAPEPALSTEPAPVAVAAVEEPTFDPVVAEPSLVSVAIGVGFAEGRPHPQRLPEEGSLRVNGGPWEPVGLPYAAMIEVEREHRLELRVPGFEDVAVDVAALAEEATTNVLFLLAARPVAVTIRSDAEDAQVYLGDRRLGGIGVPLRFPPYSRYLLSVRSPRHRPTDVELDLDDPAQAPREVRVDLELLPVEMTIDVAVPEYVRPPDKVEVFVNGESTGTQAVGQVLSGLPEGDVAVSVAGPGLKPVPPQSIMLTAGKRAQVVFSVDYLDTHLRLDVVPETATVTLNGEAVTNRLIKIIPETHYVVKAEADGYAPKTVRYYLPPGETVDAEIHLAAYTYLEFDLTPPDATVFMRGKRLSQRRVRVEPGVDYVVDIRAKDRRPHKETVRAETGETKRISVELKRKGFGL